MQRVSSCDLPDPTAHVNKALSFRETGLCLFAFFDISINADPAQQSSITCSNGFGATEETAVRAISVTNSKGNLSGAAQA
jgi:hypothetical protein